MNMIIGKKQIVMASLVAALGLAVFVNWYYAGNEDVLDGNSLQASVEEGGSQVLDVAGQAQDETPDAQEYFSSAKLNRATARDSAIENLQSVIDTCDASSDAAVTAVLELSELNATILTENEVESLITAKTGSECICNINEDDVEVIVYQDALNDDSVLAISDIIYANCGDVENIRITGA
ncbi:MAG: SpoIIIAH-like family protein [Clostridia bacterium]|nr:SpoIIIAH-like family protein [Clostridia bacterium]